MNGEEHGKNNKEPNVDLLYGVARAYGCLGVAEVAAVHRELLVDFIITTPS